MKQTQRGFTLIELTMVIVILGVLAAVAVPKFVDLGTQAKTAAIQGAAGALSSFTALNYAAAKASATGSVAVAGISSAAFTAATSGMQQWDAAFALSAAGGSCTAAGNVIAVTLNHTALTSATAPATIVCTG